MVRRTAQIITCNACDLYMVKCGVDTVRVPNRAPICVQIYECQNCKKLAVREVGFETDRVVREGMPLEFRPVE